MRSVISTAFRENYQDLDYTEPAPPTIVSTQCEGGSVVKLPKLRLKYDLAVRWVSRLTLPSISGGCDNTQGMLGCVRYKDFLTQVL
jgi:hypothetical protein